jgi:Flp pilus assembly pilin Flp
MSVTSLISGAMLSHEGWGWTAINYGSLPFIAVVLIAVVWLAGKRRHAAA